MSFARVSGPITIIAREMTFHSPTTITMLHGEPSNVLSSHTAKAGSVAPASRFAAVYATWALRYGPWACRP